MIRRRSGTRGRRFVFLFVGRVEVGSVGLEFGGARIDRFEGGHDPTGLPQLPRTPISTIEDGR